MLYFNIVTIFWTFSLVLAQKNVTTDLTEAESGRSKLEIVKQIKKINDDGSYTIGYEANDGSFKIESRDVLGNIKGTYGYIDEDGEIKRVTYTSKNESEARFIPPSVVQRIPKTNRTYLSVARRQDKSTSTTTTAPSVIQSIPRRRFVFPTQSTTVTKKDSTKPVDVVYAEPVRNISDGFDKEQKLEGQLSRPEIGSSSTESNLQKHTLEASLSEADTTIKPVTEEPEVHGSSLRRQLFPERAKEYDQGQHLLSLQQNTDFSDVYTGSKITATPRPLFTTTIKSRILPYPTTRTFNSTPFIIRPTQTTTSSRPQYVIPEYPQEPTTTTETVNSRDDFRTQIPVQSIPVPPYLNSHQRLAAVQHPANGEIILVPAGHPILSHFHVNRPNYVNSDGKRDSGQVNTYQSSSLPNPQLRGNPTIRIIEQTPPVIRVFPVQDNRVSSDSNVIYGTLVPANQPALSPLQVTRAEQELQRQIDEIEPPVSVNDFQKILDQLIIRQKKLEMVHALVNTQDQDTISRPSMLVVPQRISQDGIPIPYRQREYDSSIASTSIYSPTKRNALQNSIDNEENEQKYLPPLVREMLLLKMLKLAINPNLPLEIDAEAQQSVTTTSSVVRTGQRNVEILGEEDEQEEDQRMYRRNKRVPDSSLYY